MNEEEKIDYLSSRNGFIVSSLLLAAITVYQLSIQGTYMSETFAVLILSVTVFWGTKLVHKYYR